MSQRSHSHSPGPSGPPPGLTQPAPAQTTEPQERPASAPPRTPERRSPTPNVTPLGSPYRSRRGTPHPQVVSPQRRDRGRQRREEIRSPPRRRCGRTPDPSDGGSSSPDTDTPEVGYRVTQREKKERGRRPDPFTNRSQYEKFFAQLLIFMAQNETLYKTDQEKILFILLLFTEGTPLAWATLYLKKALDNERRRQPHPWGNYHRFMGLVADAFGDPNEE
jgi:hypothetical protein